MIYGILYKNLVSDSEKIGLVLISPVMLYNIFYYSIKYTNLKELDKSFI